MDERFDVVVIGGGAGGLSAALVLARARRRVVVIDAGQPRNQPAAHLHGYLTRDGTPPGELLSVGRAEVARYGGAFVDGRVVGAVASPGGFALTLADGRELGGRRLLIATGLSDRLPEIPGLADRWGRDVLHCPYCHGHEVADQALGVLNGRPDGPHQAITVRNWSADVTLFTNGARPGADSRATLRALGIDVIETPVAGVRTERDRLAGVELADGRLVPRAAVFVAPSVVPNDKLAIALGAGTYEHRLGRFVATDGAGRTTVSGMWAVGNVTDPAAQLITAAGDGSRAAIDLNSDLIAEDAAARSGQRPAA